MDITLRGQQYQTLRQNLAAGQIDQAGFITAVDKLGFQDQWGRYWSIGSETGQWYYYDGQNWQPGDPHQSNHLPFTADQGHCWQRGDGDQAWYGYQPEMGQWVKSNQSLPSKPLSNSPHTFQSGVAWSRQMGLWLGLICTLILAWLVFMPVSSASPQDGPLPAPSPRPPLGGGGSDGGDGGDGQGNGSHDGGSPTGAIVGQVTDLSTGQPAAGLEVDVSGQIVRTDTDGSYSITGLPAGQYRVSPKPNGQGVPAQGPIYASVDGVNRLEVDLGYYSKPPVVPAASGLPAAPTPAPKTAAIPPALPPSGADLSYRPWLLAGLGLLLILAGAWGQKKAVRHR